MADMNLDGVKAMAWVTKAKLEVASTNATLKEVQRVCTADPTEDDIIKLFVVVGETLTEAWDATTNVFEQAWNCVEDGLKGAVNLFEDATEGVGDLINQILN